MSDPFRFKLKAEAEDIFLEEKIKKEARLAAKPARFVPKKPYKLPSKKPYKKKVRKAVTVKRKKKIDVKRKKRVFPKVEFKPKRYKKYEKTGERITVRKRLGGGPGLFGRGKEMYPSKVGWFGPYPAPLGDDIIIDIRLTEHGKNMCRSSSGIYKMAVSFLESELYFRINAALLDLINRKVPKDTGALRKSLRWFVTAGQGSIKDLSIDNMRLYIRIGSSLKYAGTVAHMPTTMLAHPGGHTGRNLKSRRTGKTLRDPEAATNFYRVMIETVWKKVVTYINQGIGKFGHGFWTGIVDPKGRHGGKVNW